MDRHVYIEIILPCRICDACRLSDCAGMAFNQIVSGINSSDYGDSFCAYQRIKLEKNGTNAATKAFKSHSNGASFFVAYKNEIGIYIYILGFWFVRPFIHPSIHSFVCSFHRPYARHSFNCIDRCAAFHLFSRFLLPRSFVSLFSCAKAVHVHTINVGHSSAREFSIYSI